MLGLKLNHVSKRGSSCVSVAKIDLFVRSNGIENVLMGMQLT